MSCHPCKARVSKVGRPRAEGKRQRKPVEVPLCVWCCLSAGGQSPAGLYDFEDLVCGSIALGIIPFTFMEVDPLLHQSCAEEVVAFVNNQLDRED